MASLPSFMSRWISSFRSGMAPEVLAKTEDILEVEVIRGIIPHDLEERGDDLLVSVADAILRRIHPGDVLMRRNDQMLASPVASELRELLERGAEAGMVGGLIPQAPACRFSSRCRMRHQPPGVHHRRVRPGEEGIEPHQHFASQRDSQRGGDLVLLEGEFRPG